MSDGTREFAYAVLTPAGYPDADLAIAGSRAGALGILNLAFARDETGALDAVDRMVLLGRGRLGVLLDGDAEDLLAAILERAAANLEVVVITPPVERSPRQVVSIIHAGGCRAYLVATSLAEARAGQAAGVDALFAKGHEAGGWVGEESSFVLLQRLIPACGIPVWAFGGIGLHTAAAAMVAGAAGVVLDSQVLLARESPLPPAGRALIARMDGSETSCLGATIGRQFRSYARPTLPSVQELARAEAALTLDRSSADDVGRDWRATVTACVDWRDPERSALAVGQDAAFAADLARRFRTVGGILEGLRRAVADHCSAARRAEPFAAGSPLARSLGTRYPIAQGPMTRVSDRPEFAAAVAEAGALPFVALALMRAPEARTVLSETRERLSGLPWGVGILGFVPAALRDEQLEVIRECRPSFALIAGGRPDQARHLEADGIPTFLHVPSPELLRLYLNDGARRFVFEGRECGGHVGPRTSFVLWDTMIRVLLDDLPSGTRPDDVHVLFAGGIHDARSAAMAAALAAPLAARGVPVGVLLGTAYVFTEEAVRTGAISPGFQQAAVECDGTVLLHSGPGQATRCAPSPFVHEFDRERRDLLRAGVAPDELRNRLEELNVGRLRIAAKGVDRNPAFGRAPVAPKLTSLDADEQWSRGLYMLGQVAALRDGVVTMDDLHHDVSERSTGLLRALEIEPVASDPPPPPPADVAIVGMGCILPGAPDLRTFWSNILNKVDAITEIPASRWDWRQYYDPDRSARDRIYSRWGGFIDDVPFDPLAYGMPPNSLTSIEPFQLLTLAVVRSALDDAGYLDRPFARERTSVIFGAGGGGADLSVGYTVRSSLPRLFGDSGRELTDRLDGVLPEWTEDSFPGLLMNVATGRVANRFDLGGVNYTVDAACASSLAAVNMAVRELQQGTSDVVVTGGIDAIQNPFAYLCFSKTQALSPNGRCRTFDAEADGITISEGFAAVVLKRLVDAERDGDRVYAVIRGVGGSSDGRDRSLTAPRPEGQIRALRRAYAQARISPASVGLIEAHGTGTVAGDQAEVQSLSTFFAAAGAERQACAIGSVKSMIGHTKATAGVAGLIKASLALHHRVLPPTLGVTQPNPKANFPESPFYVNSEARPWIQGSNGSPRRAGVSAFGFGGTNFHVVLEEYTGAFLPDDVEPMRAWPAELFVWRGHAPAEIVQAVSALLEQLERGAHPSLMDLAYSVALVARTLEPGVPTLAVVATSRDELVERLREAGQLLESGCGRAHQPTGIHYAERPLAPEGHVAFVFPGQGSQRVNMAGDLAVYFPGVRACFDRADGVLRDAFPQPLSRYLFPPPRYNARLDQQDQAALTETHVAQPALGVTELAYLRVLDTLGVRPEMAAGHSYGEFVALHAAGSLREEDLLRLSEARGRFMQEGAAGGDSGVMAAVDAGPDALQPLLADPDLTISNLNAPRQTVIAGGRASVEQAVAWCTSAGLRARLLPVACAFHSPYVAPAQQRFAAFLARIPTAAPLIPVFSNTTGEPYPEQPEAITALLSQHLVRPVDWVEDVEAMYRAGARIFVEVGPRNVLTGLVDRILDDRPHVSVSVDASSRHGLVQLAHALATLVAEGVPVDLDRLFDGRAARELDLANLECEHGRPNHTPTTWLVNGGKARPAALAAAWPAPVRVAVLDDAPNEPPAHAASTSVALQVDARPTPGSEVNATVANGREVANGRDTVVTNGVDHVAQRRHRDASTAQPVADFTAHAPPSRALAPQFSGADGVLPDRASEVMGHFQQVMQRFLETQQAVMLSYLAGGSGTRSDPPRAPSRPQLNPLDGRPSVPAGPAAAIGRATPPDGLFSDHHHAAAYPPVMEVVAPGPVGPAATPEHSPATPAGAPGPPGREELTQQLLTVVSDRTGYPVEMLDLDADLEADLSIDSIKRVEIAGTITQRLALPDGATLDLERLTASRSLRQIIDALMAASDPPSEAASTTAGDTTPADAGSADRPFDGEPAGGRIGRFTLRVTTAPAPHGTASLADGVVIIVDDDTAAGELLAADLVHQGRRVVRVGVDATATDGSRMAAPDAITPESVARFADGLRRDHGPVCALIHLTALRQGGDAGTERKEWQPRLDRDLVGLFLLLQALRSDLERSAGSGGAAVLAATTLGGTFGIDGEAPSFAGQGAIVGLVKTVAHEWPDVRVRAVDFGDTDAAGMAGALAAELVATDGLAEIGYRDGRRLRLELAPTPLHDREDVPVLDRDSIVLVTGGARGITAEAAALLAERYHPMLIVVGRTPLPGTIEPPATAGITDPRALKQAIIDRYRADGRDVTLAVVEDSYRRLVRGREVRQNLQRLERAASRLEYHAVDVSDAARFGALIDDVYRRLRRIDVAIHGAGIIEDRLVRDKQLESFRRVVGTKVDSALVLANHLRPETLRALVLFSSVSGRFGNRGQGDYAAASEVLNKLAQVLDRSWPSRVTAINWGPWLTTGMVSADVRRQFAERGVELIPVDVGCRLLDEELRRGRKGEVEVLIGGVHAPDSRDVGDRDRPARASRQESGVRQAVSLPLLSIGTTIERGPGGRVDVTRAIGPAQDRYLDDHRIDGRPVLPFAVAMELMAEVAALAVPDLDLYALRQVQLLHGISFDRAEQIVRVSAVPQEDPGGGEDEGAPRTVDVTIASLADPPRLHYRAVADLRRPDSDGRHGSAFDAEVDHPGPLADAAAFPMTVEEAYRDLLFHGPRFQGVVAIEAIGPAGASATLRRSTPSACLSGDPAGDWLLDPVLLDSAVQVQLLWARLNWDLTLLPGELGSCRRLGSLPTGGSRGVDGQADYVRHELRIRPDARAPFCRAEHYLFEPDGRMLIALGDVSGIGSKALNRIVGRSR